jgi:hypothetical protein
MSGFGEAKVSKNEINVAVLGADHDSSVDHSHSSLFIHLF